MTGTATHEQQFRTAAEARGLILPAILVPGKIGRCPVLGKALSNKAGAYLFNPGAGIASGGFENHTDGLDWENWQADIDRVLNPKEGAALQAQYKKDQAKVNADAKARHAAAAREAARLWDLAEPCESHPYLDKKRVLPHGLRVSGNLLIIPARTAKEKLTTLQTIQPDGTKRFLAGGKKRGSFYMIGTPVAGAVVNIGEGFATCASVYQATGQPVAVAFDAGNLLEVAKAIQTKYPDCPLVILGDDDAWTAGNPGRSKATAAAQAVGGQVVFPDFGPARQQEWTDFNDLHAAQGLEAVKRCIEGHAQATAQDEVKKLLARNARGAVAAIPANLTKILRHDPMFGDRLSLNTMTREVCHDGNPKSDQWVVAVQEQLQDGYGLSFTSQEIQAKLLAQAASNTFHPVQEYLSGLKWDKKKRLASVPVEILGTSQRKLYSTYFVKFCVAAVRRVMKPGCKVDTVLTLVGPQGSYKSTFFQVLGGEFFNDSPIDMSSKDGPMVLHRAWISELPEIDHITSNTAVERMKAFIASSKDLFRPPYAVSVAEFPRSCILVGTSNREGYLTDATGSRRFWSIKVDKPADVVKLREWRDQLWAEAVALEASGVNHWLDEMDEAARAEDAKQFESEDPWESKLLAWVRREAFTSSHGEPSRQAAGYPIHEVMRALEIPPSQQTRAGEMRLAALLKKLGWCKVRKHNGKNKGPWLWVLRGDAP